MNPKINWGEHNLFNKKEKVEKDLADVEVVEPQEPVENVVVTTDEEVATVPDVADENGSEVDSDTNEVEGI